MWENLESIDGPRCRVAPLILPALPFAQNTSFEAKTTWPVSLLETALLTTRKIMDWVARQRAFCVLRRAISLTGGTAAGAGMPVIVFAACSTIRRAISATLVLEAPQPPVDARLGLCEQ